MEHNNNTRRTGEGKDQYSQDIYHESLLLFEQLVMYMMEQISYALNNYELGIHGW
jgi:hypothetical protein